LVSSPHQPQLRSRAGHVCGSPAGVLRVSQLLIPGLRAIGVDGQAKEGDRTEDAREAALGPRILAVTVMRPDPIGDATRDPQGIWPDTSLTRSDTRHGVVELSSRLEAGLLRSLRERLPRPFVVGVGTLRAYTLVSARTGVGQRPGGALVLSAPRAATIAESRAGHCPSRTASCHRRGLSNQPATRLSRRPRRESREIAWLPLRKAIARNPVCGGHVIPREPCVDSPQCCYVCPRAARHCHSRPRVFAYRNGTRLARPGSQNGPLLDPSEHRSRSRCGPRPV
jgi:hypothetical protein